MPLSFLFVSTNVPCGCCFWIISQKKNGLNIRNTVRNGAKAASFSASFVYDFGVFVCVCLLCKRIFGARLIISCPATPKQTGDRFSGTGLGDRCSFRFISPRVAYCLVRWCICCREWVFFLTGLFSGTCCALQCCCWSQLTNGVH